MAEIRHQVIYRFSPYLLQKGLHLGAPSQSAKQFQAATIEQPGETTLSRRRTRNFYAFTITSSAVRRELATDFMASSAVNLPMTNASLRLGVIWMGSRSILRMYCGARLPTRFTFTRNLIVDIFTFSGFLVFRNLCERELKILDLNLSRR
jgi:hypothetical protein